jgi:hypothetical protein
MAESKNWSVTVTHNLGTYEVQVTAFDLADGERQLLVGRRIEETPNSYGLRARPGHYRVVTKAMGGPKHGRIYICHVSVLTVYPRMGEMKVTVRR